jgi:hypothetical protein
LGLIISDASYAMIAPPTSEATYGTAAKLSADRHVWEEDVQTYRTYTSVQQALKKQIISVFDPMYLDILNDNMVGYDNVSARDMLDHLFEKYGNITAVNLEINFEHMRRAWDSQQPVETLFKQIQDCANYSEAGGVLIGHPQKISVGYAKNIYNRAFHERLLPLERETIRWKTWTNFKSHFAAAHRQHNQMQGEYAATAGYHSENAAMTQNEDQMAEATIGALASLETAAASDRGVVAALTQANSRLAKQLEDNSSELRELKALLSQERRDKRGPRSFNPYSSNNCWTHGYKFGKTHTSHTCNTPQPGHKVEATRAENMGGSQANKEWCAGAATLNNNATFEVCRTPRLLKQQETAIVESGCTGHFLLVNAPCLNKVETQTPLTVRLPNGATMESSHTNELAIPELNAAASKAHVFPGMSHHSLLSVEQLCDEGYIVTFKKDTVTICNSENSTLLSGPRDVNTGLWRINVKQTHKHIPDPISNNVYELRNTGTLVHYLHKALFSPTRSVMLQAVKDGHLITWPGLTEHAINKHLKLTTATAMGHMNQRRQNIRSTSKAPIDKQPTIATDLGTKTHLVYAVVVDQGHLNTNFTGKFPVWSSKGNSYVMVCYIYDCNYVKIIPMKSRSASEWVKAYDSVHQALTVKDFKPKLQTLDNEASAALKNFFTASDIIYQLVPPHCHWHNAAKRAIRTFKEHFVAGLSSVDPSFPMHLWDRLLPQGEITLNLLRTSRLHPQLPAAAHFHGIVDYNKTDFATPGCKIIAHEKPGQRRTWAPHGHHGYSLGPAMHHYWCQNVYISSTASERIVETLELFLKCHSYRPPTDY